MTTYLVPLDGSPLGETALPWAKLLAGETQKIHLLRCLNPLSAAYPFQGGANAPKVTVKFEELLVTAGEYLDQVTQTHSLANTERTAKEGKAAETILAESQSDEVEAIVLSSHGAGGLGKWLVGSVTSKVLKGSTKPVFVVRAEQSAKPPQIKKIVVCLDGSPLAERGLIWAAQLAQRFQAEIKLIQVVNHQEHSPSALKESLDESASYLKVQAKRFPELKIETAVRTAGILEGVLKESSGYDLTIVSSHGHGGFQRWLLGSLTEKILNRGQTTLLVIPSE